MAETNTTLRTFYDNWALYQNHLVEAIAPLSPEQLTLRAAPHLRSIGMIATHMIGARARWFYQVLGEGGSEIEAMGAWDREGSPTRTAGELVEGLQATWRLMREALDRWTPEEMAEMLEVERGGRRSTLTREWVIWHLLEHDLHHGGEISLTLGIHQLAALEL